MQYNSFKRKERANVSDIETFDEKNPPMVLLVLFLKNLPLPPIVKKGIEWVNENSK
jgi:hypothetical protein